MPDSLIDPADYATLDVQSANTGSETTRSKRQYSTPNHYRTSAKATRGAVVVAEDVQPLSKKNKTASVKAEVDDAAREQVIWACCTASNPSLLHCSSLLVH